MRLSRRSGSRNIRNRRGLFLLPITFTAEISRPCKGADAIVGDADRRYNHPHRSPAAENSESKKCGICQPRKFEAHLQPVAGVLHRAIVHHGERMADEGHARNPMMKRRTGMQRKISGTPVGSAERRRTTYRLMTKNRSPPARNVAPLCYARETTDFDRASWRQELLHHECKEANGRYKADDH